MPNVFLFGAGVSAFCGGIIPRNPPLGNHLFRELCEYDRYFDSIEDPIRSEFNDNFEKGMASFTLSKNPDIGIFIRKMASYFLQFETSDYHKSSYYNILKIVKDKRIKARMATLNYDLLLDQAIAAVGGVRGTIGADLILKIHGAPNLWPDVIGMIRNSVFAYSGRANVEAPIRRGTQSEAEGWCKTEDSIAPAMSLYAIGKKNYYSPTFVEGQQAEFVRIIYQSKAIVIAGVHLNEDDTHIWNSLANSPADIGVINPNYQTYQKWSINKKSGNLVHIANTLDEVISESDARNRLMGFLAK